ncbi:MAG: type II secretion system secretin GspD [Magnetococcales bacterium]|nr:type II secretion system secretin GspD [Magnetococcales bacterium]
MNRKVGSRLIISGAILKRRLLGRVIGILLLALMSLPTPGWSESYTLNLKDADLRTLVETVSAATGRNFILDPKVKGKVTVVSSRSMSADEMYSMFLSILEVHGYIAVEVGDSVKIVPDAVMRYSGTADRPQARGDDPVVKVFELDNIDASKLAPVLRPMISPKGHLGAYGSGNMLILSDYGSSIQRMTRIIHQMDQPDTGQLDLVPLEHASAINLVAVINRLYDHEKTHKKPSLVADSRSNSILLGGDKSSRLRLRALIAHLDSPVDRVGNTEVVYLRYAKAAALAEVLNSMGQSYVKKSSKDKAKTADQVVNVQPFQGANALVITAPPDLIKSMKSVIRSLDIRRAQVQVEAIIAEVSLDKAAEFGIQWNTIPGGGSGIIGGTNFPGSSSQSILDLSGVNRSSDATSPFQVGTGLNLGLVDGTSTLLGTTSTTILNLGMVMRMLRTDGDSNILQTPTVVTLDNEEAEIIVGEKVPFVTRNAVDNAGNPLQNYERENVGLTLRVTPQINEGSAIRLDILQELSDVKSTPTLGVTNNVVTNTRSIRTAVMVDNRQILVLGGLMRDKVTQSQDKVPLLGDIPLLGALFRYESNVHGKTNLMVFLRPKILRTAEDGREITEGKYNTLRQWQLDMNTPGWLVDVDEENPILPDMKQPESQQMTNQNHIDTPSTMAPAYYEEDADRPDQVVMDAIVPKASHVEEADYGN